MRVMMFSGMIWMVFLLPRVAFAQWFAPPTPAKTEVESGLKLMAAQQDGSLNKDDGWLWPLWKDAGSAVSYFGGEQVSGVSFFSFTAVSDSGKSVTAKLLGVRLFNNLHLSLYSALTSAEAPSGGSVAAEESSQEGNLENFIQAGGNATLLAESLLGGYVSSVPDGERVPNMLTLSAVSAVHLDIAPLGMSRENGVKVGQLGLRFFGQKAALDNADFSVFADVWMGGLWGTPEFFNGLGQTGRRSALHGKATVGFAIMKKFRLNVTKVVMGPEKMRTPWIVSLSASP